MANNFMTPKEAAVALVSYHLHRGPHNGSFATVLIEAFQRADLRNRERLLKGYPEFAEPLRVQLNLGAEGLEQKIEERYFDDLKKV